MNTNIMRRFLSLLLVVLLLVGIAPVSFAAVNYSVNSVATSTNTIYKDTKFNLTLKFQEFIDGGSLTLVNKDNSTFILQTGASSISVGDVVTDANVVIPIQYMGKGNEFSFDLVKSDGTVVFSDSVIITGATPTDSGGSTTESPELKGALILSGDMTTPVVKAGTTTNVAVKLDNIGNYSAVRAKAYFVYDDKNQVFDRTSYNKPVSLDSIQQGKTGIFTFSVKTPESVKAGTYDVKLRVTHSTSKGNVITEDIDVPVKVENSSIPVILGVVDAKVVAGTLSPGQSGTLEVVVRNGGTLAAYDALIKLSGFSADGVQLNGDLDTKNLGTLANGSTGTARYKLTVPAAVKTPVTLKAEITYLDAAGKQQTFETSIFVPIAGVEVDLNGIEATISGQTKSILPGGEGYTKVTIKNTTANVQKDIKLTMTSDAAPVFLTPYTQVISKLNAGESRDITFKYVVKQGTAANTYPVFVEISAPGADTNKKSIYSGLTVKGDEEGGSKPKIIIESYDYGGESVMAGSTIDLLVRFSNTSGSMGIRNAKVVMTADEGIFIPVDAANSFFIDKIGPNESFEQLLTLKVKADAKVQMYGITFKIDYEDQNGKSYDEKNNPYTAEERISLSVKQEVRLEVSDVVLQPEAYVGNPLPIEVEFFNMGKSPMYNLMVKVEGNFQAQNSNYFVGNFDAGRSDFYSASIIPDAAGELKGDLIFVYEDETGLKQEVRFPLSTQVVEGMPPGMDNGEFPIDPGLDPGIEDPNAAGFKMPLWGWAAIIVVPLGVGAFVFLRIRKKKRMKSLLEVANED